MFNSIIATEASALEATLPIRLLRGDGIPDDVVRAFHAIERKERAENVILRLEHLKLLVANMLKYPQDYTLDYKRSILLSGYAWMPFAHQKAVIFRAFCELNFFWRTADEILGLLEYVDQNLE